MIKVEAVFTDRGKSFYIRLRYFDYLADDPIYIDLELKEARELIEDLRKSLELLEGK